MSFVYSFPLIKKKEEAKEIWSFYFDCSNSGFTFFPGQYTKIKLPMVSHDELGISREFTIASSPLEKDILMITTNIGKSEFKKKLFNMEIGESAEFTETIGGFYVREEDPSYVLLSGGIGITPFRSIITSHTILPLVDITLLAGFSRGEKVLFQKDLETVALGNARIKIVYTISNIKVQPSDHIGQKQGISENLINKHVKDLQSHIYMISGPYGFVESTIGVLKSLKINEAKIKTDIFTGY